MKKSIWHALDRNNFLNLSEQDILNALEILDELEQMIITHYYGINMHPRAISELTGVQSPVNSELNRHNIERIKYNAINKMRNFLIEQKQTGK